MLTTMHMKAVSRSAIEAMLSDAGLEMTPRRFAVLEYLARSDGHSTAEQIVTGLNRHYPRPSRKTICDMLCTLRDAGVIKESLVDDAEAHYEMNIETYNLCNELEDD